MSFKSKLLLPETIFFCPYWLQRGNSSDTFLIINKERRGFRERWTNNPDGSRSPYIAH